MSVPPRALLGHIYHRISTRDCGENGESRKRPRPWDGSNGSNNGHEFYKGYIFIPDEGQHLPCCHLKEGHEFSLVMPFQCLRAACYAAATGKLIQISQYSLIRYRDGWGDLIFSSRDNVGNNYNVTVEEMKSCSNNNSSANHFVVIEVHHDGLYLDSSESGEGSDTEKNDTPMPMTLEALAQKEAQSQQCQSEDSLQKSKKKKKATALGKDPTSVIGVVDAISPILVNEPQGEPFAIMELYQPAGNGADSDVKTAVAVIRGERALCVHPAIHPGQSITLVGVITRRWKVPDEFQKHFQGETADSRSDLYQRLNNRVPDRVILITEASAIRWNDEYGVTKSLSSSRYEHDMSLPSTVESLTSIRGIVQSVHYYQSEANDSRRASHIAHFVSLKLLDADEKEASDEPKLARIYLPKYAMPPNLVLGMQPGAILRAVNIHFISPSANIDKCDFRKQVDASFLCYVACLRSTLAIERCAGESNHRSRSSHTWFITEEKPFVLLPDHCITDICSDPFNTKSSAQYLAEVKLRNQLESKLCAFSSGNLTGSTKGCPDNNNTLFTDSKLDTIIAHHHRSMTSSKLNDNREPSRGCSCVKRKSNRVNGRTMRDPYAEFFDHAHNQPFSNGAECGSSCNDFSAYNHYYHFSSSSMPYVVRLEDLRDACAQNFINRIGIALRSKLQLASSGSSAGVNGSTKESSRVFSGWRSSYFYQGLNLCQVLNDHTRSNTWSGDSTNSIYNNIYTWGSVEVDAPASIYNNKCAIPICELQKEMVENASIRDGSPGWIQIDSVVVSCLCLGSSLKEFAPKGSDSDQEESEESYMTCSSRPAFPHTFLPSSFVGSTSAGTDGHGFIFLVGRLVVIASVQITTRSVVPMDRNSSSLNGHTKRKNKSGCEMMNASTSSATKFNSLLSIRECLEQTPENMLLENSVSPIGGTLVRQRFNFRKLKSVQSGQHNKQHEKRYEGWTIILCHSIEEDASEFASVLQTVEVKISVPFDQSTDVKSDALNLAMLRLFNSESKDSLVLGDNHGKIITPDQATMGLAWWAASEDSRTSPLLSGGWDECSDQMFMVHVEIPLTSRTFSNLGYQRFRCNLNEIRSFFGWEPNHKGATPSPHCHVESEFNVRGKFLPGMLNRRLGRVPPLVFNVHQGCERKDPVYRYRNQHSLLTRLKCHGGVPSATLAQIHWDICAALKEGDHAHLKPSLLRRIHNPKILGISFCRARVECTQCFQVLTTQSPNNAHLAASSSSSLCCPSGCSRSYAAVKWECSAIIDDSTGQAKLYAEREGALLLLGDSLDVATIENGVWTMDGGVFFQPSLPASSHLMECIKDATAKASRYIIESKRQNRQNKKEKRPPDDLPSPFSLLPADAKAEYLLHQHCRQWYQHHHQRRMDLFCRCKPLSENVTSVNQAEIQVAKAWVAKTGLDFGTAPTATLPPLKLTLEDACLASEESFDDKMTGWNLLNSYKKNDSNIT